MNADNILVLPAAFSSEANMTDEPLSYNSHSIAASLVSRVLFFTMETMFGLFDSLPELPHHSAVRLFIL